eukprot:scaffold12829_cov116-Isochrysis_galbana.AAC.8
MRRAVDSSRTKAHPKRDEAWPRILEAVKMDTSTGASREESSTGPAAAGSGPGAAAGAPSGLFGRTTNSTTQLEPASKDRLKRGIQVAAEPDGTTRCSKGPQYGAAAVATQPVRPRICAWSAAERSCAAPAPMSRWRYAPWPPGTLSHNACSRRSRELSNWLSPSVRVPGWTQMSEPRYGMPVPRPTRMGVARCRTNHGAFIETMALLSPAMQSSSKSWHELPL